MKRCQLLEEAIEFIGRTGQGYAESEIYRLRGEAELQLGDSHIGSAAKWFERAIDAARKHSARIAELRATANLARLLAKQASATKRARCSPTSTTGSPRASTPPT